MHVGLYQVLLLIPVREASEYYLHHPAREISSYRGLYKPKVSMELNSYGDMQIYVVVRSELIKIREECIQKKSYYVAISFLTFLRESLLSFGLSFNSFKADL